MEHVTNRECKTACKRDPAAKYSHRRPLRAASPTARRKLGVNKSSSPPIVEFAPKTFIPIKTHYHHCTPLRKRITSSPEYQLFQLFPERDSDFLRVLWRANETENIKEYRLDTVTYGVDCAPWQALRTMHQIADDNAEDEGTNHTIKNAFYVDDEFYGADTIERCKGADQTSLSCNGSW